ncbi:MAG: DUF4282 domain-containing protein [Brachybacterium tyrofermentans]|uniref:DUF4282 domain-containing protein n=1 Tax=Brachybacterium tyrofermentans TaxID=47848 RepID=UPI000A1A40AC|nr:DUF4282 domain-containing protein [Brachybacterium tyrofermentans]SLN05320.1 hypothetical protein FM103_19740 [Corynebacterium xerosis]
MSHPSDGDRFDSPYPEQNLSADQPWADSEQQASPYGDQQASGAASGSEIPSQAAPVYSQGSPASGQGSPAYGQGSPAYGQGSPAAGAQIPQDPSWVPAPKQDGEAGFFRALFDFTFTHFITVKFSAFLYIVAFVVALLLWLGQILCGIMFGAMLGSFNSFYGESSFNAVPLILAIVFGWIPSVIALIAMRLGLEFSVATVRTAQNTKKIAEQAQAA